MAEMLECRDVRTFVAEDVEDLRLPQLTDGGGERNHAPSRVATADGAEHPRAETKTQRRSGVG